MDCPIKGWSPSGLPTTHGFQPVLSQILGRTNGERRVLRGALWISLSPERFVRFAAWARKTASVQRAGRDPGMHDVRESTCLTDTMRGWRGESFAMQKLPLERYTRPDKGHTAEQRHACTHLARCIAKAAPGVGCPPCEDNLTRNVCKECLPTCNWIFARPDARDAHEEGP